MKRKKYNKEQLGYGIRNWIKKHEWIVPIMYIFIPIIVIYSAQNIIDVRIYNILKELHLDGAVILNSEYAKNNIFSPFSASMALVIGIMISFAVVDLIRKKVLKNEKVGLVLAKKVLHGIEIFAVVLAVVVAVYSQKEEFDYNQYGYGVETIKSVSDGSYTGPAYISLEQIPAIHSIGISSPSGTIIYNGLLLFSQKIFHIKDNIPVAIALLSAIIIPLKKYVCL